MDLSSCYLSTWDTFRILGDEIIMLKDVLNEINQLNSFSKSLISKNLNLPIEIIDDLVQQLIRMGYLDRIESPSYCERPCSSCPYARSCNIDLVKMYQVSQKGHDLLNNN